MALKNCRECNKKVSTEAASCPSCGAPHPTLEKSTQSSKPSEGTVMYTFSGTPAVITKSPSYGESLIGAFWGGYVGGNIVGKLLLFWIKTGLLFKIIFGAVILWNIFMIYLVFELADEYKASAIHEGKSYGWATTAKIAIVLLTLSAIGNSLR